MSRDFPKVRWTSLKNLPDLWKLFIANPIATCLRAGYKNMQMKMAIHSLGTIFLQETLTSINNF